MLLRPTDMQEGHQLSQDASIDSAIEDMLLVSIHHCLLQGLAIYDCSLLLLLLTSTGDAS
jgi:hypothetical protein